MGGQEALLLLARYPRLLAGVAAFDAPTDLGRRYTDIAHIRNGRRLQTLMRLEVGATPNDSPSSYAQRSPLDYSAQLANSHVPIDLWWSTKDHTVTHQNQQTGRLYEEIKQINPNAPITHHTGTWAHAREFTAHNRLPQALRELGLLPPANPRHPQAIDATEKQLPNALGPTRHGSTGQSHRHKDSA